jgi:hypothetical protein
VVRARFFILAAAAMISKFGSGKPPGKATRVTVSTLKVRTHLLFWKTVLISV